MYNKCAELYTTSKHLIQYTKRLDYKSVQKKLNTTLICFKFITIKGRNYITTTRSSV